MKNKKFIYLSVLFFIAIISCKKDTVIGNIHDVNVHKNITSYEYLQTDHTFDTLVQLIDAAGLKELVNKENNTFFAVTNRTVYNYLQDRTKYLQAKVNQYAKFGLDSLINYLKTNKNGTADSLKMYIFNGVLSYNNLNEDLTLYPSNLTNDKSKISYTTVSSSHASVNTNLSTYPKVLQFSHNDIFGSVLLTCTSSGINTKNGVVHVLANHNLFFSHFYN